VTFSVSFSRALWISRSFSAGRGGGVVKLIKRTPKTSSTSNILLLRILRLLLLSQSSAVAFVKPRQFTPVSVEPAWRPTMFPGLYDWPARPMPKCRRTSNLQRQIPRIPFSMLFHFQIASLVWAPCPNPLFNFLIALDSTVTNFHQSQHFLTRFSRHQTKVSKNSRENPKLGKGWYCKCPI